MNWRGAVPGEGPRSGWHGSESWGTSQARQTWQTFADRSQRELAPDEWMATYKPNWMGTDRGEEIPHARENTLPDYQYTGPDQSDERVNVAPPGLRNESPQAGEHAWPADGWYSEPARGSNVDGWTAVTPSSTSITTALADDRELRRWPAYEVEAAHYTKAARIGIGMVEQPLSRPQPALRQEAAKEGEWKAGGCWEKWEIKLKAERQAKGYHSDLAIRNDDGEEDDDVDLSSGMSDGGCRRDRRQP